MSDQYADGYWTRRLVFTPPTSRATLDQLLTEHFEDVRQIILSRRWNSNLYVSGSLARGEPSATVNHNGIILNSDVDFVLVGLKRPHGLGQLEIDLNRDFPEFLDTIYYLPIEVIPRLVSASAADLREGMLRPLIDLGHVAPPAFGGIGVGEMLEVIAYQLAGLYARLPSSLEGGAAFWSRGEPYQRVKVLTELLRMLAYSGGGQLTLQSALQRRAEPPVSLVFSPEASQQLISVRERGLPEPTLLTERIPQFVLAGLRQLLELPDATAAQVLRVLGHKFYFENTTLHAFPLITFACTLWSELEQDCSSPPGLVSNAFEALCREASSTLILDGRAACMAVLRQCRSVYLSHWLGQKDSGGVVWPAREEHEVQVHQ
jgi:hypothetical protein